MVSVLLLTTPVLPYVRRIAESYPARYGRQERSFGEIMRNLTSRVAAVFLAVAATFSIGTTALATPATPPSALSPIPSDGDPSECPPPPGGPVPQSLPQSAGDEPGQGEPGQGDPGEDDQCGAFAWG
ncbi:hypothetical protein EV193_101180 [Herbihabitans rhizosphaerae]|uniref:Uncharacterized protein n=2 Tax=Herbihabitans rhizosphaerae TaxID=1872711 RepID=A0A4Q7L4T4_9PSEU|nr:hypothetical protein EV193_101180 [Herbihabitans rhizosphaerae]